MEAVTFLAPAHNPPYVAAMRSFRRVLPLTPLVALFETAFFDQMPASATTYAVPYEWKEELGVRRYGFHGASHRAAAERVQALLGRPVRHISCHLGGSSSVAGIRDGVAVETSFGLSPQSGLPQNNRVGDLDVFAALFVMKQRRLDPDAMAALLATKSGLAGISGVERRRARPRTGGRRAATPVRAWPSTSSCTRCAITWAPASWRWAAWTCSPSPAASARTARRSARPSAPASRILASPSTPR